MTLYIGYVIICDIINYVRTKGITLGDISSAASGMVDAYVQNVAGVFGKDRGSQDRIAKHEQEVAKQQALVDEQNAKMEEAKKRQLSISNQNKVDALRRRRGGSSMLSGGDTISNDAQQNTLG